MATVLVNILWPFGAAAYGASTAAALAGRRHHCLLLAALGTGILMVVSALEKDWVSTAWFAAVIVALLGWDYWNRGGRKAAKAAGAKSRALVAALVAKAREAGTPLPEGVRA